MPGDDFGIIGETKKNSSWEAHFPARMAFRSTAPFSLGFPLKTLRGTRTSPIRGCFPVRDEIDVKSFMMNVRMERCSLLLSHRAYVYNQNQNDNTCQIETHITTLLTLKSNFALVSEYITYCSGIFALFKLRASLRWTGHMT